MSDKMKQTQDVQDKPAEKGILYNNILTFLILAVISWVGVNITQMKDSLSDIKTDGALIKLEQVHMRADIKENSALIYRYHNE